MPPSQIQLDTLRTYLCKQKTLGEFSRDSVHPDLGIVVVIPCYDEPELAPVLESLQNCQRPRAAVEILLVVNASELDDEAVRRRNQSAMDAIESRWTKHDEPRFRIRALNFPRLPARHAGVGLARKIGMDEAVRRFLGAENSSGIIASVDADCICDSNYLRSLETHFDRHPTSRACTIYFEHALSGPLDEDIYRAVTRYELFLRYYRQGLQLARFPYAHYTVGSCLAVRCNAYARHGGMNRRKAGEDFYFLNKLMAVGDVSENNATRVMPGVRLSSRTPFGTGRALSERLAKPDEAWLTYDPRVFRDLGELVSNVDSYYDIPPGEWPRQTSLSSCMEDFLTARNVRGKHAEIRANSASPRTFRKRFFQWFDGALALKFVHSAIPHAYPRLPLEQACATVLRWDGVEVPAGANAADLLQTLRMRDRNRGPSLTADKSRLDS